MRATTLRRPVIAGMTIAMGLSLAACGGSSNTASSTATKAAGAAKSAKAAVASKAPMTSKSPMSGMTSSAPAMMAMGKTFGAACSAVPKTGSGSFTGMATDPVATAASHNPVLSSLVGAVKAAGLVDTLNGAKDITVFAPYNGAFAKLPKATMNAAMKDPKGLLTKVLTYHVVAGRLTPAQLAGTHKTLEGATLKVAGSGSKFTVNGGANVICGNVHTANATVYIIDSVLMPKM